MLYSAVVSYKHIYEISILELINLNQSAKTPNLIDLISTEGWFSIELNYFVIVPTNTGTYDIPEHFCLILE